MKKLMFLLLMYPTLGLCSSYHYDINAVVSVDWLCNARLEQLGYECGYPRLRVVGFGDINGKYLYNLVPFDDSICGLITNVLEECLMDGGNGNE